VRHASSLSSWLEVFSVALVGFPCAAIDVIWTVGCNDPARTAQKQPILALILPNPVQNLGRLPTVFTGLLAGSDQLWHGLSLTCAFALWQKHRKRQHCACKHLF
jgi:hypothetical protein